MRADMKGLRPISTRSIYEELQERIKEYVILNNLQPGDPLPTEAQLAEQLGVSRAVVREGLRALESLGVIHSKRGEGRYVSSFSLDPILQNLGYSMLVDVEDVQEILDVRQQLEVGFVREAIAAMNEETLVQLRGLVAEMHRKAAARKIFRQEDLKFHRLIYEKVGNKFLLKLLDVFWEVSKNLRYQTLLLPIDLIAEAKNHKEILRAIEAKQVEEAQRQIVAHFDSVRARLVAGRIVREAEVKGALQATEQQPEAAPA
ncbi:MAG: FadR family transcriptional regulator [Anaerolineae bacterium]|nr:FadR family transcriptional regulator [Anaerolineae bacterium]